MKHKQSLMLFGALLMTLAGCSSTGTAPGGEGAFGSTGADDFGSGSSTFGNEFDNSGEFIADDGVGPGGDLLDDLVVYFDYDSSEIRSDFNEMLAAHGQYLAANQNATVRLEGHADERGSREYNIGLGERRAQQVRQILLLQGASVAQLSTVSYGEERPAVFGSDDEAYQLNRRVEIVYR